jgi:dipeptidyl-peptidase-3
MKKYLSVIAAGALAIACNTEKPIETENEDMKMEAHSDQDFDWSVDKFADIEVLRYQIPGWDKLSSQQRIYTYYLVEAGLAGRDIIWDQNYRHNLEIRHALEKIVEVYTGDVTLEQWVAFEDYAKRVFFSNGIHHHYSKMKHAPGFDRTYFDELLMAAGVEMSEEALEAIFNPEMDKKKVVKSEGMDLVLASAGNMYDSKMTQAEAEAYYASIIDKEDARPISYGLNSKLVYGENGVEEEVYKVGGLYGKSLEKVVFNLQQAAKYAENEQQAIALGLLVEYYQTGDLKKWDEYNIAWVQTKEGDVDYINGFVEVYEDPLGKGGSYETVVEITDFDASERMKVVADNVQWFEDNSTIMDEHKKKEVKGVSYKVVSVAGEAGDASPSTPIGVNLPNANWIRQEYGSKSVSLGNIEHAYESAKGSGFLKEFAFSDSEIERAKKYGSTGSKMHTALHEVVGHASGQINEGVGQPSETMKNYASTLEEARADLVALYFIMDAKMQEIGLMENDEAGKAEYDNYIRNGMMTQLYRILPGAEIEEDHMRNRQLVASWAYEQGLPDNVVERKTIEGKTYFVINDYAKLRVIFGELLSEIQRIKSEGDFEAGKALVEGYGVKVDEALHKEVLARTSKLNIAPYKGFVNPVLVPKMEDGKVVDVTVEYAESFMGQMMMYGEKYGFLD